MGTVWVLTSLVRCQMSKEGHDYILVLIDRFTKMAKMRACTKTIITASETGKLLLDMMLDVGKLPSSIVSDRDVRFTGAAWGQLWRGLKTELKMSTAYHPQTDGQTERMNQHDADGAALVRGEARGLG